MQINVFKTATKYELKLQKKLNLMVFEGALEKRLAENNALN